METWVTIRLRRVELFERLKLINEGERRFGRLLDKRSSRKVARLGNAMRAGAAMSAPPSVGAEKLPGAWGDSVQRAAKGGEFERMAELALPSLGNALTSLLTRRERFEAAALNAILTRSLLYGEHLEDAAENRMKPEVVAALACDFADALELEHMRRATVRAKAIAPTATGTDYQGEAP